MRCLLISLLAVAACEGTPGSIAVDLAAAADDTGHGMVELDVELDGHLTVQLAVDDHARVVEVAVDAPDAIATRVVGAANLPGDDARAGSRWFRPRPVPDAALALELTGHGAASITAWVRGPAIGPIAIERSLKWRDAAILDNPELVGLGRVMAAIAPDGHGGRLFDHWMRAFAATPHSQRPGPALFMDEIAAQHGDDPGAWDLDALPFRVTAVHNRIDLAGRDPTTCGQLRITLASLHEVYAPLHLIFLFAQPPGAEDVAPDGAVHCLGTARAWSRLSGLDDEAFAASAADWLARYVRRDGFLLAETLERAANPGDDAWEWRQWEPMPDPGSPIEVTLVNPPLFQTIDVEAVNADGPVRDQFLAFVEQNAAALNDRSQLIPAQFRPRATRLGQSEERPALDLTGLPAEVLAAYPDVADQIEISGCPACHTTPAAEFVQTYEGRFESDFHFHELEARAELIDALNRGELPAHSLYGPVQPFVNFATPL